MSTPSAQNAINYNSNVVVVRVDSDLSQQAIPPVQVGYVYVWPEGKKVFYPCFNTDGSMGLFTCIGSTTSAPAPTGITTNVLTANTTLQADSNNILANGSSIILTLPTGLATGKTISVQPALNTAGCSIVTSGSDVIVLPNSQNTIAGTTSTSISANQPAPVSFTYYAEGSQWIQAGAGTLTNGTALNTQAGQIDFSGHSAPALVFQGTASTPTQVLYPDAANIGAFPTVTAAGQWGFTSVPITPLTQVTTSTTTISPNTRVALNFVGTTNATFASSGWVDGDTVIVYTNGGTVNFLLNVGQVFSAPLPVSGTATPPFLPSYSSAVTSGTAIKGSGTTPGLAYTFTYFSSVGSQSNIFAVNQSINLS